MQALSELLKVTHRGYFIPPRPEKNPVEGQRASDEFLKLRCNALQKYLVQLALHPAIAQSDVSDIFVLSELAFSVNSSSRNSKNEAHVGMLVVLHISLTRLQVSFLAGIDLQTHYHCAIS